MTTRKPLNKYLLYRSGKIHRMEKVTFADGTEAMYTICGLYPRAHWNPPSYFTYIKSGLAKKLPEKMRCKICFGIKTPLKEKSLDFILGLKKR